mgnify:CR=1 FL=1
MPLRLVEGLIVAVGDALGDGDLSSGFVETDGLP